MPKQTRNNIMYEIEKESSRFVCPDYRGVIFVHPDDVGYTIEVMLPYMEKLRHQNREVTLKGGGLFKIATAERYHAHYDYAGWELTSILLSFDCFGKHYDYEGYSGYLQVSKVSSSEFILYMASRLRSQSQVHSHMVLF